MHDFNKAYKAHQIAINELEEGHFVIYSQREKRYIKRTVSRSRRRIDKAAINEQLNQ